MNRPTYYDQVYAVTKAVPRGRVTTYGAIADFLALGSARMVGWALNKVANDHQVPAHRVVNRKGALSGRAHFRPPGRMQDLLEQEGVVVENDQVQNFKEVRWIPAEHLSQEAFDEAFE